MGFLALFYPWGIILQAMALVHFVRRRPDTFWLWIILIGGGLGALVYIVAEVVPDATLASGPLKALPRRRRIRMLEAAIVENPAVGNREELADLYLEEGKFARARELYDSIISPRTESIDPFYRRGIAEIGLGDFAAAVSALERVVAKDPKYDLHRALGLLAHAHARSGNAERAEALFQQATAISTLSETYYNYASFLTACSRRDDARVWAQRILDKRPTMPGYLRRIERLWFRKAKAILRT